jgi:hypothetical protein
MCSSRLENIYKSKMGGIKMEHRYYSRIAVRNRLLIHASNSACIRGVTKNISNGGLALEAVDLACLKRNGVVRVAFMVNGTLVSLRSQVIRASENEAALMFIEETSLRKQMLKNWLNGAAPNHVTVSATEGKHYRQSSVSAPI